MRVSDVDGRPGTSPGDADVGTAMRTDGALTRTRPRRGRRPTNGPEGPRRPLGLYVPGASVVHRLPAHCKLAALLAFVLLVVATPPEAVWAFGGYAVLLLAVALVARVPLRTVTARMVVELPVVVFALLLPFIAQGPRVEIWGPLVVSETGLLDGWNVLAKATLGVVASILLAATTEQRDLLAGLERLRLPGPLVQIAGFMVRYLELILDQMRRMRTAQLSRGLPGGFRSWPATARAAGALFIRTYERGERVHLAMLSRGYNGRLPADRDARTDPVAWGVSAVLPLLAALIAAAAWWTVR